MEITPEMKEQERIKSLAELKKLALMVDNWKASYLRQVDEYWKPGETGEEWEFVCKELIVEVEDVMYPYIQRMKDCEYITSKETNAFMNEAYEKATSLKEEVALLCAKKQEEYEVKKQDEEDNDPAKLKEELEDIKSKYELLMERLEALER